VGARPGPGATAQGAGRPARPARAGPATDYPANPYSGAGPARPPVRPPGPGRRAGRPRPGHPSHRNHTLNRTAFKVYRYVASGLLDDQEVTVAFTTVALAIGLSAAETARTLASARTAGLANPRAVPAAADASRQEVGA
jgi:hypothetical protein